MKEIKMSNMFQTSLVYNYSKAEDLKIIVDEPMPDGAEINVEKSTSLRSIKLIIEGDVGKEVKIRSPERKVDVMINGDMKERASIELGKGNVVVKNVSRFAQIMIQSGCIMVDTVNDKAYLDTQLGCILSNSVKAGGQLEVGSGFITADTVDDAKLRAKCGKVYINQDNRNEHNKGWEKFQVTSPTNSTGQIYDRLNDSLSTIKSGCDSKTINNVFNAMNCEFRKTNQPTTRKNGNKPRRENVTSGAQSFDWESFDRTFDRAFGTNVRQAAAVSDHVIRISSAEGLHFGDTHDIDIYQRPSPQRQRTARQTQQASTRSTTVNANQTQAQQATAPSSESRRTNINQTQTQRATASQNTGDIPPAYEAVLDHNLGVAVDEHPLYQNNNIVEPCPPSYQDVVGSGAAAANNNSESPPEYSDNPRANERTINAVLDGPSVAQLYRQSQKK